MDDDANNTKTKALVAFGMAGLAILLVIFMFIYIL